tara:strand:+ start:514 stop:816 length:303 start_codon:yes stop_codon:yes gene_type:complete
MTEPMDTQEEILEEYGMFKASQLEVLDMIRETLEDKKQILLNNREDIEDFYDKSKTWGFLIFKKLKKWGFSDTKENTLTFTDLLVASIDECINEIGEKRR